MTENAASKKYRISVGGKVIAYELNECPEPGPTIVMLHPVTSSMQLEDKLQFPDWRECALTHSLLRFDAPGHGHSDFEHDYKNLTWQALAETLCELLDRLAINQIVLAGSSMGAGVALHTAMIASRFNLEIDGLSLIIPPMSGEERQRLTHIYKDWANTIRLEGCEELVQLWRKAAPTAFFQREFPEAREICFQDFITRDKHSMAAAFEAAAWSDLPSETELKSIKCPVQIFARIDDPIHPISAAEKLATLLPQAKLRIASNAAQAKAWPKSLSAFANSL